MGKLSENGYNPARRLEGLPMTIRSQFGEALEATERLSLEEREELMEVLRRRTTEERRGQLKREIAEANVEFARGKCKPSTPAQIMRELLK